MLLYLCCFSTDKSNLGDACEGCESSEKEKCRGCGTRIKDLKKHLARKPQCQNAYETPSALQQPGERDIQKNRKIIL